MLAAVVSLSIQATAQSLQTVKIQFGSEGERKAWIQTDENADKPGELIDASKKELELATSSDPNGKSVFVLDAKTNRVAQKNLVQILKTGSWSPKTEDYKLAYQAKIVFANAKGQVANGLVVVKAGDVTRQALVTPDDQGVATVYLLPGKTITVTGTTKVDGKESTTDPQTFELPADGLTPTFTLLAPAGAEVVTPGGAESVPKDGEKVTGDKASSDDKSDSKAKEDAPNPLASLFNLIIGLAIVGGIGYAIYWYYNNNQTKVEELVKKAGLESKDPAADPTGALPAVPDKPKPVQKIMLGDGAVTPNPATGAPSVPIAPVAPASKTPRLVSTSGETFAIQDGSNSVGRENAAITVAEQSLSRHHAELVRSGDSVTLTDVGSTNGTYVNGVKLVSTTVLQPGDTVQFGAAQFTYQE